MLGYAGLSKQLIYSSSTMDLWIWNVWQRVDSVDAMEPCARAPLWATGHVAHVAHVHPSMHNMHIQECFFQICSLNLQSSNTTRIDNSTLNHLRLVLARPLCSKQTQTWFIRDKTIENVPRAKDGTLARSLLDRSNAGNQPNSSPTQPRLTKLQEDSRRVSNKRKAGHIFRCQNGSERLPTSPNFRKW